MEAAEGARRERGYTRRGSVGDEGNLIHHTSDGSPEESDDRVVIRGWMIHVLYIIYTHNSRRRRPKLASLDDAE